MDITLDQFISETLKSIIKGINDTKDFASQNDSILNPTRRIVENDNLIWHKDGRDGTRPVTKVNFDIAVTASNEEANKLNGGVKINIFQLGASSDIKDTNQTISKISFSIEVALPSF